MRVIVTAGSVLLLFCVGCSKSAKLHTKEAVQAAIESYLQQRANVMLANLTLEVAEVRFAGDRAEAEVKFHSRKSPDLVVAVHYQLRQAGDHWQVESSNPSGGTGGSPHGGGPPSAPAHAPTEIPLQSSH